jgi:hypothetical protein
MCCCGPPLRFGLAAAATANQPDLGTLQLKEACGVYAAFSDAWQSPCLSGGRTLRGQAGALPAVPLMLRDQTRQLDAFGVRELGLPVTIAAPFWPRNLINKIQNITRQCPLNLWNHATHSHMTTEAKTASKRRRAQDRRRL